MRSFEIAWGAITGSKQKMTKRTGGDDVDLSGVLPQRRETVRRRIAALEEYDGLPCRTAGELTRLSEPLGLSPPSFYRLWRSWRTLRDPAALQGATAARGLRDPVDDRAYVRDLLATMPEGGSVEAQVLEVERSATAEGVALRSRSALRRLVREIHAEHTPPPLAGSPAGTIGLDVVPIEIAVSEAGVTTLPLAAVLLHPRTSSVLSVHLSLGEPSPAMIAAALARWLDGLPTDGGGTRISAALIPSARDEEWRTLWNILGRYGLERGGPDGVRMPAGAVVADSLGRQILGFDVRPRMAHRPAEARRPLTRSTRLGGPIPLAEAQAALNERIDAQAGPPMYLPEARVLASALRNFEGSTRR